VGGLGDVLLNALMDGGLSDGRRLAKFGVEGQPACGTPPQVLKHHRRDGPSPAQRIARPGLLSFAKRKKRP